MLIFLLMQAANLGSSTQLLAEMFQPAHGAATTCQLVTSEGTKSEEVAASPPASSATASAPGDGASPGKAPTVASSASASVAVTSSVAVNSTPGLPQRVYGILHAMTTLTQGVQSYGLPTANAPTSTLNPALGRPGDTRLTLQTQQTRLGVMLGEGTPFHGQLEVDFIHFDQSSPTTQAFPRMRIALLEWQFAKGHKLFAGQTWDVFGNTSKGSLLSHSVNLVGSMFQAGNIGFMRQQLGWQGQLGALETTLAVGLPAPNPTAAYNNVELRGLPSVAGRLAHAGANGTVGLSGLASSLVFGADGQRHMALGAMMFGDVTFGPVNLHGEAYWAQNLANMGALNLGYGREDHDLRDVGGYLSAKYTRGCHAFTVMGGAAKVLSSADVAPGYTQALVDSTGKATPATTILAAGPGIQWNTSVHVGYWYSPRQGFSLVVEPYVYGTKFALQPVDQGVLRASQHALGVQTSAMWAF